MSSEPITIDGLPTSPILGEYIDKASSFLNGPKMIQGFA